MVQAGHHVTKIQVSIYSSPTWLCECVFTTLYLNAKIKLSFVPKTLFFNHLFKILLKGI